MDRVTFSTDASLSGNTLSGIAHTFGQRAKQGSGFVEFAPGAFNKALRKADVRAFVNHNTDLLLGRQSNGTVKLSAKADGLHYDIDLPDTTYASDLKVLINRGDLNEMSFGIFPGKFETRRENGVLVTYHTEVAEIFDISPVSLPAFGGTSAILHSQRNTMNLSETLAAMDALRVPEGEAMSDEAIAQFKQYEADVARFNESDAIRKRITDLRKPIVGFPAVVHPSPKGDEALDFAFEQYLRTGQKNTDIAGLYAQTIGSDSAGGYLAPSGFRTKITERMAAFGGFGNLVETIDTGNGNPIEWPTFDDVPANNAQTDAAQRADIVAEGAASAVGADLAFGTVTLGAYRYAATGTGNVPIKVSVELLQDAAFDVVGFVTRALGTRIARKQATHLLTGTGVGMPLGILSGTDGDVTESTLTYAKLLELVHKLDLAYRPSASWLFNDNVALEIESLVDGAQRPLLTTPGGIASSVDAGRMLLGYPVHIDNYAPDDSSNVQYIGFGDWRESYIKRNVRDVQVLVNPYAATGYVVYDAWARMDGKIQNYWSYVTMEGE